VQINSAGQVVLKLKTAWRDGTTHIVMRPLEFMQRLAALVPRPRLHLTRFHGVLAPNAKLRALVVPAGQAQEAGASGGRRHEARPRTRQASADQLGPAAQARVRDRPRTLPELRRPAQDHCGHPRIGGDKSAS